MNRSGRASTRSRRAHPDRRPRAGASLSLILPLGYAPEVDAVVTVDLGESHPHVFGGTSRQVLTDLVVAQRQLSMTAIDEHSELHRAPAAQLVQCVECRSGRA